MPEIADYSRLPSRPKVSVAMITYNHASFIEQAVRSAVRQQTDFDYEIVVGDDYSSDETRERLILLQREHPDRVRLLFHDSNLGQHGKLNLVAVLKECRGQFIALLEGDDVWISRFKLQTQVMCLERNPELSGCFHPVWFMDEAYRKVSYLVRPENEKGRYLFEDFISTNVSATCSVMFRRDRFPGFPDWFFRHIAGDWSVNLLNLTSGPYGYLPEPMSAYRIHGGGVWTSMSQFARLSSEATFYGVLLENLDARFHPKLKAARLQRLFWASKSACEAGDKAVSKEYFKKTLAKIHENRSVPLWHLAHHFLNLFCPQILEVVRKVRK